MSSFFSFLLLAGGAALYTVWQQRTLKQLLGSSNASQEWIRQLTLTGAMITLILVVNGLSYLKMKELETIIEMDSPLYDASGKIIEPSSSGLYFGQFEVIGGTLSLVALVWATIRSKASKITTLNQQSFTQIMLAVVQSLLLPFWLATLGIGSIFGVSAGFGLKDIIRHAELLLGPPLIMAIELSLCWAFLKFMATQQQ